MNTGLAHMMSSLPLIGIGCKRFSKVGFMFARASGFRALLSELRDWLRIQSRFTFVQRKLKVVVGRQQLSCFFI